MKPYIEFTGTLQNSGFWLVKVYRNTHRESTVSGSMQSVGLGGYDSGVQRRLAGKAKRDNKDPKIIGIQGR